jgi:hypothetical protein
MVPAAGFRVTEPVPLSIVLETVMFPADRRGREGPGAGYRSRRSENQVPAGRYRECAVTRRGHGQPVRVRDDDVSASELERVTSPVKSLPVWSRDTTPVPPSKAAAPAAAAWTTVVEATG